MAKYTSEREFDSGNDNVVFRKINSIHNKKFVTTSHCMFDADAFLYCYVTTSNFTWAASKKELKYIVKIVLHPIPDKASLNGNLEQSILFGSEKEALHLFRSIRDQLKKIMEEE